MNSTFTASIAALPPKGELCSSQMHHPEHTWRPLTPIKGYLMLKLKCKSISLSLNLPISEKKLKELQEATAAEPTLETVAQLTKQGWPGHKSKTPADAKPTGVNFKEEIHEADGIFFKNHKMIFPEQLRPEMPKRIHESHLGIEKSKRRARDTLYWPNMNVQISDLIANCSSCLKHRKNNVKEPLIQHDVPDRPWQQIACDLFTLGGKDYLLTADCYSKWVEIGLLRDSTMSSEVITQL